MSLTDQDRELLASLDRSLKRIVELMDKPSPGWRRMLDEFKGAIRQMPTSIRMRP